MLWRQLMPSAPSRWRAATADGRFYLAPLAGRGKHLSGGVNGRQPPVGPLGPGLNQLGPGAASRDQHRSPLAASQGGGCQQCHRQSGQAGVARNQLLHDQVVADGS